MIALSKIKKYILIVIALSIIIDGALFIYWYRLAKNDIRKPEKITEMKEYSNPFYSFKYPISYKLDIGMDQTEHKKNAGGQDVYGLTSVWLYKEMKNIPDETLNIFIGSYPVGLYWKGGTLSEILESIRDYQESTATNGKIEIINVVGKEAIRVSLSTANAGRNVVNNSIIIPTDKFVYEIDMSLFVPPDYNPDEEQAEFEEILKSFTILQ